MGNLKKGEEEEEFEFDEPPPIIFDVEDRNGTGHWQPEDYTTYNDTYFVSNFSLHFTQTPYDRAWCSVSMDDEQHDRVCLYNS